VQAKERAMSFQHDEMLAKSAFTLGRSKN
jgi:hypothetical protein